MWVYDQPTGQIFHDEKAVGTGYSGKGEGKDNPAMESVHNVGPIPKGRYTIGPPHNTLTHGPYVLPLTPDPDNLMHRRSGFLIHGDSRKAPGTASEGCIILARAIREGIWQSGDHRLEVTDFFGRRSTLQPGVGLSSEK